VETVAGKKKGAPNNALRALLSDYGFVSHDSNGTMTGSGGRKREDEGERYSARVIISPSN
jgi:hypothetical protein